MFTLRSSSILADMLLSPLLDGEEVEQYCLQAVVPHLKAVHDGLGIGRSISTFQGQRRHRRPRWTSYYFSVLLLLLVYAGLVNKAPGL